MKIHQDTNILQQVISALSGRDGASITLNFIENMIVGNGAHLTDGSERADNEKHRMCLPTPTVNPKALKYVFEHDEEGGETFFRILTSFPEPRLEHFFYHVYRVCAEYGKMSNVELSKFLGQGPSTITNKTRHYGIKLPRKQVERK